MAWENSDERRKIAEIEEFAQTVFIPRKLPTPAYIQGEQFVQLQRRLLDKTRPFVDAQLQKLKTDDAFGTTLAHMNKQYLESSVSELRNPTTVPDGQLREVVSYDQSGRPMYSYFGSPSVWMSAFAAPRKRLAGINASLNFTKV
jgi:hypothetical protein